MDDQTPIVYGNYEDKYGSPNPVYQLLLRRFFHCFHSLLLKMNPTPNTICEIGCGEGELLTHIRRQFPGAMISGTDISEEQIAMAAKKTGEENIVLSVQNAENLQEYADQSFDLVICVEVLEHLPHPEKGLQELTRISRKDILVSVPNEPIWRILNMMRGKYWKNFGNTPGHLNHWSIFKFPRFINNQTGVTIVKKKYPLPWQMMWLRKIK